MAWFTEAIDTWIGFAQPSARSEVAALVPDPQEAYCPGCGSSIGIGEVVASKRMAGCRHCRGRSHPIDGVVRLGTYTPPLRGWVLQIKYRRWESLGRELGRLLGRQVQQAMGGLVQEMVVVPVPMPPLRRALRGIDHANVLAKSMARQLNVPLVRALDVGWTTRLTRQASLPGSQRKQLSSRRWKLTTRRSRRDAVQGHRVLLVDDVLTTGATLRSAARALAPAQPSSVWGAVVAVRDLGREPPDR